MTIPTPYNFFEEFYLVNPTVVFHYFPFTHAKFQHDHGSLDIRSTHVEIDGKKTKVNLMLRLKYFQYPIILNFAMVDLHWIIMKDNAWVNKINPRKSCGGL